MGKSKRSATRQKKPIEFTCFPKFPREIRDMVWKHALPGANTIQIYAVATPWTRLPRELKASYKVPTLLHVSQESRLVAKKHYDTIYHDKFGDEFGEKPVYLDPTLDVLFIRDLGTMEYIWRDKHFSVLDEHSKFSSPVMKNLRRLMVGNG
jgi:hypothetical protein